MTKEKEYLSNDFGSLLVSDNEGKISVNMEQLIDGLCLMDDEFMTLCFKDNIPAVEEVLNTILDRDDLKIITLEVQHLEKSPRKGGRGIRMDVYARDDTGKYYDIEIQRSDHGAGKHRARLYSAMMDVGMLNTGQDFDEMKDSYVIFITENDVMQGGEPLYHFRRMNVKTGEIFEDGSHIIFVNGAYQNDGTRLGKLIEDLKCSKPEKMHSKILEETTAHFKRAEGGKPTMSTTFQRVLEEYGNAVRKATTKEFNAELSKKDAALSEKDATINEKDAAIASIKSEKDAEIAFLKAELEKQRRKNEALLKK